MRPIPCFDRTARGAALAPIVVLCLAAPAGAQLTPLGAKLLEECAAAGDCETNDRFGRTVAVGNFNGDGFDDLAVGIPGETVGGDADTGAVHIFYGSASGLLLTGDQIFHQGTEGIADTAEPGDHFGHALASADFDADGFDDLAISAPDDDVGEIVDAGVVWVLFGGAAGLSASGSLAFGQGGIDGTETSEAGDRFGFALAAGRIDSGSRADLVIGVPGEDGIPLFEDDAGKIHVIYNSGTTPLGAAEEWTQSDSGCDSDENGDAFGRAVAVVDLDGDGFGEVVVGSPFETILLNGTAAGLIHVFDSGSGGLSATNSYCLNQFNGLVNGNDEAADRFGAAFGTGDFDGDGDADLGVASPGESFSGEYDEGVVEVLLGGAGISFEDHFQVNQGSVGEGAEALEADHFGGALAAGDFDGDGRADLAAGAPDDDGAGATNAGEIAVLYGSASGLSTVGQTRFHSNLPTAMPDSPQTDDHFGIALAAGDFDGSGTDDLAIGVSGEGLGTATAAGMVNVLYGLDRATGAFGTVQLHDDSGSVSESGDRVLVVLSREGGAVLAASVEHTRTGGTATPDVDFDYTPASESWGVGDLGHESFFILVTNDTLDEPNETVTVALSNPSAGTAVGAPGSFTLTIVDDDVAGVVQFAQPAFGVREDAGSISIPVSRTAGAASGVTVQYATSNGSASAGSDYTAKSGTVTFGAGDTSETITVPILDDGVADNGEVFLVTLSSPGGGASLGTFTTFQAVIVDDEIFLDGLETANTSRWSATAP